MTRTELLIRARKGVYADYCRLCEQKILFVDMLPKHARELQELAEKFEWLTNELRPDKEESK